VWERPKEEAPSSPYYCRVEQLPTSSALVNPPGEIKENVLVSLENGTSYASFYFQNLGPTPVQSLTLVMEYMDKEGGPINRVPYAAVTKKAEQTFHPPFPVQMVDIWERALLPGEAARVQGANYGTRIAGCPAQARVTAMMIQFSNGATQSLFMPGWRVGPLPKYVPEDFGFPPGLVAPPLALTVKLMIDPAGHVQDVVTKDQGHAKLFERIKEVFLRVGNFHPGLLNGQPTSSELVVSIRFHAVKALSFPAELDTLAPITLLDFFPDPTVRGGWIVSYGGVWGGSGLPLTVPSGPEPVGPPRVPE